MSEIHKMWEKTGITVRPEEGDFRNNGERASCEYMQYILIYTLFVSVYSHAVRGDIKEELHPF